MFYKTGVDICNTKSMWNFLHDHFIYYTMNSWNRSQSIANNVKLYNLDLEGDWTVAMKYLLDETDCAGLQSEIDCMLRDFVEEYPWTSVFFNGRSGGYLVLGTKNSNGSVLPDCVTDYDCYEDFKADMKDKYYRVSDFYREIRDTVKVVRAFDKLCDQLRDLVNDYSKRSFDADKLEQALEWFDNEYGDELVCLELTGPVMEGDRIKLNDLENYKAYMTCFMICLGTDHTRVTGKDGYLWLKEN